MDRRSVAQTMVTEWPTLFAIAGFWSALLATAAFGGTIPAPVSVGILGILGAFYMSLQHEVIHGHPTPSRRFNWAMVAVPLGLVLPFSRYRAAHVGHHSSDLTNPIDDPESFYVLASTWDAAGPLQRSFLRANRTLAGRLVLGPWAMAVRGVTGDLQLLRGDREVRRAWLAHAGGVALVVAVVHRSPLPVWVYLLGFVYVGSSLTSLRSFAEHRMRPDVPVDAPRAAVVRAGWFFSLLFLNNNLHHTHHQLPGAAWFRLPQLTDALGSADAVADSAGCYDGYTSIVRRYLFRPFEQPVHPRSDSMRV